MESEQPEKPTLPQTRKRSRLREFFTALLWFFAWPLVMGIVSIPVFYVLFLFFGEDMENGWGDSPGYVVRGYAALLFTAMALICAGIVWFLKRKKKTYRTVSANVLAGYMWLGIVIGIATVVALPDPQSGTTADAGINVERSTSLIVPSLATEPAIVASLQRVGATDIGGIETKFVDGYNDKILDSQTGQYRAVLDASGKWSYGIMTAKNGQTNQELDAIIAHEYLHHVWFKLLDEDTKRRLTSDMITIYGNDPLMHQRVESYSDRQTLQPTELFSYYCTESSNRYLTNYILAECNKYINRAALIFAR